MGFERTTGTGVTVHYGPRDTDAKYGGGLGSKGMLKQAVFTFDYNDLPAAGAASNLEFTFPAYSKIVGGYCEVLEALTTGGDRTSVTVGTTIGDATGLDFSIALSTQTAARGTSDAIVIDPPVDVGSAAAEMVVTLTPAGGATGAVTAGKLRIVAEYLVEGPGGA